MSYPAGQFRPRLLTVCIFAGALASCTPAPTGDDSGGGTGTGGSSSSSGGRSGSGGTPGGTGGSSSEGTGGSASSGSGGSTSAGTGGSASSGTGGSASTGTGGSSTPTGTGGATTTPDAGGGSDTPAQPMPGGPFPPGPHKVVLLLGDPHPTDPSKIGMTEILIGMKATHGVELETMPANQAKAAMLMDKALVIAGPNTTFCGDSPDPGLKTLPVPIMVSKDCKTSEIGIGTMMNTANSFNSIKIANSDHPLAAGLSGTVRVFTDTVCRLVRGGNLGAGAIKIANSPVDTTTWSIFAYEKGGMLPGNMPAPAKRVGFFWHRPSNVTADGKKLFIAAVEWAIRP